MERDGGNPPYLLTHVKRNDRVVLRMQDQEGAAQRLQTAETTADVTDDQGKKKKTNNPKCFQSGFVSRKTYFLSLENEMLILSRMFQSKLSKPGRNMYSWTYGKKRRKRKFNTVNN